MHGSKLGARLERASGILAHADSFDLPNSEEDELFFFSLRGALLFSLTSGQNN
jgi:hypothetical protein